MGSKYSKRKNKKNAGDEDHDNKKHTSAVSYGETVSIPSATSGASNGSVTTDEGSSDSSRRMMTAEATIQSQETSETSETSSSFYHASESPSEDEDSESESEQEAEEQRANEELIMNALTFCAGE